MKENIAIAKQQFEFLLRELGFTIAKEFFNDQQFRAVYQSDVLRIRIENYHRDIYLYTSSVLDPDNEANLFTIVGYINQGKSENVEAKYCQETDNIDECYRTQIEWLAQVLKRYFPQIHDFYSGKDCQKNIEKLTQYTLKKNPKLFAQW